jgi:L-ascorbate metabolism protein UlaG (beta-lactamase superfamily)
MNINTLLNNINIVSMNAYQGPEAFYMERSDRDDETSPFLIKQNNLLTKIFLIAKNFFANERQSRASEIHSALEESVKALNRLPKSEYLGDKNDTPCSELFLAAQRYNQLISSTEDIYLFDMSLFDRLPRCTKIALPEAAPIRALVNDIKQTPMDNIPQNQQPHIEERDGFFGNYKLYHYNEADTHINHWRESIRIFSNTQFERLMSLIGRIVEAVVKVFGQEIACFKKYHYFRNDEDKKKEIYAEDPPLSLNSHGSSYWVGHATCMLNVPISTEEDSWINVNIITDPVEGDLNTLLYPRMTEAARSIDACPVSHVITLSHNHLDHFDKSTLKKLVKYQPIVIVPEGDAKKFMNLGFNRVYENNWWQTTTIPIQQGDKKGELKITAVPANHWSAQELFDAHHSAFVGYVIHKEDGDIYFAGDTARLSEDHIATLRNRFNIRTMFQPGGPDEAREDMKSTHQASVDGLWMHFNLMVCNLYDKGNWSLRTKKEFIEEAKKLRTIYMHTKTFKLGNLHFDDTEESIKRAKECLNLDLDTDKKWKGYKDYEDDVLWELEEIGRTLKFSDDYIDWKDILNILDAGVIIPKIGSTTSFAS